MSARSLIRQFRRHAWCAPPMTPPTPWSGTSSWPQDSSFPVTSAARLASRRRHGPGAAPSTLDYLAALWARPPAWKCRTYAALKEALLSPHGLF